jgi:outer membrane protein assembly factor BamB
MLLDAEPKSVQWKRVQDLWRAELPTYGMDGGAHQLAILCDDEGTQRVATCEFLAHSDDVQMRWRRKFAGSLRSAPVWAGGNLAVASTAGEVTVLDPESGNPVWSAKTAAVIGRPLGCDDGTVVVSTAKGWIEAYGRDGSLRWRFQAGRPVFAALAGDGELVFAADAGGDVHALEISTGARRWKGTAPASHLDDPPRVADGRLLLVGEGLELALDIRTGAVLERTSQVQPKRTVGIEEAGKIAKVSDSGLVELLDSANAPLWSWRATAGTAVFAPPLLRADGTVWVAAMDGSLSCVRAR